MPALKFVQLRDREWLAAKLERQAVSEIAAEIGCTNALVSQWARKHGLSSRHRNAAARLLHDRGWLHARYLDERKSTPEIATELGCSDSAVVHALNRHGIARRDHSTARQTRGANYRRKVAMPEAALRYRAGESLEDLGAAYCVSSAVVKDVLLAGGEVLRTKAEATALALSDKRVRQRMRQAADLRKRPTGVRGTKKLLMQDAVCCFCGETEDIEEHHLNAVRSDHRAENIAPLCQDCHRKVEWFIGHATNGLRRAYSESKEQ